MFEYNLGLLGMLDIRQFCLNNSFRCKMIELLLYFSFGLEKAGPYAAPPNMGAPPNAGYKDTPPYAQQPPYGYPSSSMPPPDQHVPTNPDTDPFVKGFEFNSESIRRGFIRKVYSILSVWTYYIQ